MNVSLVSRTTPDASFVRASIEALGLDPTAELLDVAPEQLLVYVARGSSDRANKWESYEGLVRYLIKHRHWSPFQFVDYTFEIETSRAISLQIVRHASFDFQQYSQRYADSVKIEPVELRGEPEKNRQSSSNLIAVVTADFVKDDTPTIEDCMRAMQAYRAGFLASREPYRHSDYVRWLACKLRLDQLTFQELREEAKVAGECARMFLPEGTSTTLYMKGSIRSWLSFLNVRLEDHAQKEVRDIAKLVALALKDEVPTVFEATDGFGDLAGGFM
jgi:thymidylate synthase (FAD)